MILIKIYKFHLFGISRWAVKKIVNKISEEWRGLLSRVELAN
jgi:hypothetical protein